MADYCVVVTLSSGLYFSCVRRQRCSVYSPPPNEPTCCPLRAAPKRWSHQWPSIPSSICLSNHKSHPTHQMFIFAADNHVTLRGLLDVLSVENEYIEPFNWSSDDRYRSPVHLDYRLPSPHSRCIRYSAWMNSSETYRSARTPRVKGPRHYSPSHVAANRSRAPSWMFCGGVRPTCVRSS